MLKIKYDINQQYSKTIDLHVVKSESFSLTWSCGSRQRDTISSRWKFGLNNLAVKGLTTWDLLESFETERAVNRVFVFTTTISTTLIQHWTNTGSVGHVRCDLTCSLYNVSLIETFVVVWRSHIVANLLWLVFFINGTPMLLLNKYWITDIIHYMHLTWNVLCSIINRSPRA